MLSGLRACCGARVLWVPGLFWVAPLLRAGRPISGHDWDRWCACLFLGACSVGVWEQWRWRVLRAGSVGLLLRRRILVEVRTLLCGAYSVRGFGFILFVMRWIIPLCLILTAFSPLSRSVPKPCAETSYLRVQCLCGRADVWSARAVGATILDVFGYGLPTESGVGAQWRYCYCRGREVGNRSEKDMGSLGKFAFIPFFPP